MMLVCLNAVQMQTFTYENGSRDYQKEWEDTFNFYIYCLGLDTN